MAIVSFEELMEDAKSRHYAVGYFESWDLESIMAVADAAEATSSPVILGFSGIYLTHPERTVHENLSVYSAMGNEVCRHLSVPACLIYNESPDAEAVYDAVELGFGIVMFSDETLSIDEQTMQVKKVVARAHAKNVAVEGEMLSLPGVGGELMEVPEELNRTDPIQGKTFVEQTGIDALAVSIGQAHLHGRQEVRLDIERLLQLRKEIQVPLVLHGATSVYRPDLAQAIRCGINKINVGSILKQTYLGALRRACNALSVDYNVYEAIGSGLETDVLVAARGALQKIVEDMMRLFGSAGKASLRAC